jgi:hypothetical protein
MTDPYSGLEVAPGSDYCGLEHYKIAISQDQDSYKIFNDQTQTPIRPRFWGVSPRTFWVAITIVTVVVVAAAVGGGVGGTLLQKRKIAASSSNTSTQNARTTTPLATSSVPSAPSIGPISTSATSTVALTTTQIPGPTTTLLSDCPSSNNTLYTVDIGSGMSFRKICGLSYLNTNGIAAVVNSPVTSLDDCINLCAMYNLQNQTEIAHGTSHVCNAVCWRNTFNDGDEFPGQCFGYTTQNSSNAFVVEAEAICDSAAWINQSF